MQMNKSVKGKRKGKALKAGGAVGLAGLCITGVASGVACPLLLGAAGVLAWSAFGREEPPQPVPEATSDQDARP